ncbi:MAG: response regulator [Elusimicrobia bacterium]|nr:response regulator [Elusimicrobiota bacterium]
MAKKVLVVDDDEEIVQFVEARLREAGYEVFTAYDGRQGLDQIRAHHPDLVLLDLAMPVMHGFEVCQAVRADHAFDDVKIIVTSGKSYAVDIKAAKRLGADEYVVKPYDLMQLLETVVQFLGEPAK